MAFVAGTVVLISQHNGMTAIGTKATEAGASSHTPQMSDQANSSHIETEVKRFQVRIAKANPGRPTGQDAAAECSDSTVTGLVVLQTFR